MATKASDEKYLGAELHLPLSPDGQVTAYVWPVRIFPSEKWDRDVGGPTIGVQVCNEEILRWDCHEEQGHWHGGGYDRLMPPDRTIRPFPKEAETVQAQLDWAFQQIDERCKVLLEEAEHGPAVETLDPSLLKAAISGLRAHLDKEGDLRGKAIQDNLISA